MTTLVTALRPVSGSDLADLQPLLVAAGARALRLAIPLAASGSQAGEGRRARGLRSPDLVADLRAARGARFADRYQWLALRRRRAQIAARHALED